MTKYAVSFAGVTKTMVGGGYGTRRHTVAKQATTMFMSSVSFGEGKGVVKKFGFSDDQAKAQLFAKFMAEDIAAYLRRCRYIDVQVVAIENN